MIPSVRNLAKNFTNPCWSMPVDYTAARTKLLTSSDDDAKRLLRNLFGHPNVETLCCIPKVFLAGFPKSGSTTLYDLIVRHPLVESGMWKEPHWWTRFPYVNKFPQNLVAFLKYVAHYCKASLYIQDHPDALAIDGSQSTIWDTKTSPNLCSLPKLISSLIPNGKYIVIMREPASRLYSDFRFCCKSAPAVFHTTTLNTLESFERCLRTSTIDLCTHFASGNSRCSQVRIGISLYHVHIARWLSIIPREQFLFLRTEDLASEPYAVMKEVWAFLGLKEQSKRSLGNVLHKHSNVNPMSNTPAAKMRQETQVMLRKFFQPFNKKLAELLGDTRFLWDDN